MPESEHIDYLNDYSPWLFDRAMTLYGVYARTGDVTWLRRAHRATRYYVSKLDANGYFVLKGGDDLKYSYGQALLTDLMLTGDTSLLTQIEAVASAGAAWNPVYQPGRFWTERHQTYALLAALSAWEATGSEVHAARVRAVADATFDMTETPAEGWTPEGCPLHRFDDHEGAGGLDPVSWPMPSGATTITPATRARSSSWPGWVSSWPRPACTWARTASIRWCPTTWCRAWCRSPTAGRGPTWSTPATCGT